MPFHQQENFRDKHHEHMTCNNSDSIIRLQSIKSDQYDIGWFIMLHISYLSIQFCTIPRNNILIIGKALSEFEKGCMIQLIQDP